MPKEEESRNPGRLERDSITPEHIYLNRRHFMQLGLAAGAALSLPALARAAAAGYPAPASPKFPAAGLNLTKESVATSYNNFYEFSLEKGEVKDKVKSWQLDAAAWRVEVAGLVAKPRSYSVDELISLAGGKLEERVYRFRCVEAWSMVVPWTGFPLSQLVEKLQPKKNAKFIKFVTFGDKKIGPNLSALASYPWPYTEGLTLAEARHPLALVATGLYGKPLPKQNGAPLRIVVPWKYGFKSCKSLVRIEFTDEQPKTLWNDLAPAEYGFYANVNPHVDHPRWSQATERILDDSFFPKRQPTLLFNGYEKEIGDLYKGLDLAKNY